ncbi:MAG: hypothetical protein HY822_08375 [Acidobacteria bacterium]|nr:hypothetical protein [Acidobacteriota bacterium]
MKLHLVSLVALLGCGTLPAQETIQAFGLKWSVPIAADWKVESAGGVETLRLLVPRPSTAPRRPAQFAVAQTPDYLRVTVEAEMKQEPAAARNRHTSLMIAYAWRDADHFNYAHLSVDAAKDQPVHNGIFHVFGGDRVRISSNEGPATLATEEWHKVRLVQDGKTGKVQVWVDGKTSPSMQAVESKLGAGKIGIGSFFDLGEFRKVRIQGEPAPKL